MVSMNHSMNISANNDFYDKWLAIIFLLNLIIINGTNYFFVNLTYPMVGHDYGFAIPQILDSVIHFSKNSFSVQWYTPSFGGGIPAFPDPNNAQFSLFEILPILITPWHAIIASTVIFISLGFLATIRFLHKGINLSIEASILGAAFLNANGFIMERVAVGHLCYQPFPLIAVIMMLLFDSSISSITAGILLGSVLALLVHQAGYFLIIIFIISMTMVLPLVYLVQPKTFMFRKALIVSLIGGITGLLLSASKLSAVYSFMRFFPRLSSDIYDVSLLSGLSGLILQLLGTMTLLPLFLVGGLNPDLLPAYLAEITGGYYGYWEYDMSVSPIVLVIILLGILRVARNPKEHLTKVLTNRKWVAVCLFIVGVWICAEFTLATGFFYSHLRKLPILSSLHVNARFAAAFLLPLTFLAAVIYNSFTSNWSAIKSRLVMILINILTLLPLGAYFMFSENIQGRTYDIKTSEHTLSSIRAGNIPDVAGINNELSNTEALALGQSNLKLYNPIFGYQLESFHPEVKPGSIWLISNGFFNMTNPSGFAYPDANQTRSFERIKTADRNRLKTFSQHYQPDWEMPLYQKICNWTSGLTAIFTCFFMSVRLLNLLNNK